MGQLGHFTNFLNELIFTYFMCIVHVTAQFLLCMNVLIMLIEVQAGVSGVSIVWVSRFVFQQLSC